MAPGALGRYGSASDHAHVAAYGGFDVAAVDDEVVALGLAGDSLDQGASLSLALDVIGVQQVSWTRGSVGPVAKGSL